MENEFERFKEFFKKYGVEYLPGHERPNNSDQQFIEVLGISFEFKNEVFTHLYEPEYDTKVERLPNGK